MDNIIELQNVSKQFNDFSLNNINLQVKRGYATGFIGTNGSGKSTIIKIIMNLLKPDKGTVNLFGKNYEKHETEIKQRIGFVYDSNIYYGSLNLHEIKQIVAPTYKTWNNDQFHYYTERFELPLTKPINKLSKGTQMKASIAIALSHDADLIIMDEPTTGVDPTFRLELLEIFQDILVNENKSIFFSTHTTSDLERFADYIILLDRGRIIFQEQMDKLQEHYALVKGPLELLDRDTKQHFIHIHHNEHVFRALTDDKTAIQQVFAEHVVSEQASLEDIMYFMKAAHRQ